MSLSALQALPPELRSLRPVQTLARNLQKGRLAHAILLRGEDLQQIESVALALAAGLLKTETSAHKHPDCFTLRPAKKSRTITIGQRGSLEENTMRRLIHDLQQTANQGGHKVAIVYEADRMNAATANAFLKTLEEPPRETTLLLLTTRPYDLLDTIRSRCFQFRIPSPTRVTEAEGWADWLEDYRAWIHFLHLETETARSSPDRSFLEIYGLISRFSEILEAGAGQRWKATAAELPDTLLDDEIEAMRIGQQRGFRDQLLVDIESHTRLAAIELSHRCPFPALMLARAIAALESITGLLALNMKDDAALEAFFLESLRIWTA
jgi:DNA polymerase-3 subunit delta'